MSTRTKALLWVILLAVVDTAIPVPIVGLVLAYGILVQPPWFVEMGREICGSGAGPER